MKPCNIFQIPKATKCSFSTSNNSTNEANICVGAAKEKMWSFIAIFFFLNWYFSFVYCLDIICTHQLPLGNTTRQHTGTETDTDTDYSQKLLMEVNAYFLLSYFWIFFHYQRMKCLTWHIAIYYAVFIACLQKNPTKQIVFCYCVKYVSEQDYEYYE